MRNSALIHFAALAGAHACLLNGLTAADLPKPAPVPASPFITVVYRYADTLLDRARDTNGPQATGLFLSALDRATLAPLTNRPAPPPGVHETQRAGAPDAPLTGANVQHDENLLRLLFLLSELSAKPKYSNAAAAALSFFLTRAPATNTHLLPWGEYLSWDVLRDEPIAGDGARFGTHTFFRPWLLWDRCFDLEPAASQQFALGLWEHQVHPSRGALALQAGFAEHSLRDGLDDPRQAGFCLRTWAVAYARTGDTQCLNAIERLFSRFEGKRHAATGWIPAGNGLSHASVAASLSLAIDCDGAAHYLSKAKSLSSRMRAFAAREDELFCALPHPLKEQPGFCVAVDVRTGRPTTNEVTRLRNDGEEARLGTRIALMCVSRYDNTGKVGYRDWLHAAASLQHGDHERPETQPDLWPGTLGQAISLQLAAWRSTARAEYLERARELGRFALEKFFEQGPLPKASLKSAHYEAITGADTLALALAELHLQILHITAVRCPPNTIDR